MSTTRMCTSPFCSFQRYFFAAVIACTAVATACRSGDSARRSGRQIVVSYRDIPLPVAPVAPVAPVSPFAPAGRCRLRPASPFGPSAPFPPWPQRLPCAVCTIMRNGLLHGSVSEESGLVSHRYFSAEVIPGLCFGHADGAWVLR